MKLLLPIVLLASLIVCGCKAPRRGEPAARNNEPSAPVPASTNSTAGAESPRIIVTPGSSSSGKVATYNDPRIRYMRQEHIGVEQLGVTYNRTLALARSPLIAILEGDDYWPPDKLGIQIPAFDESDAVLSFGIVKVVSADGTPQPLRAPWPEAEKEQGALDNSPVGRAAVAMAIDRAAVTQSIRPDWQPVETLLPTQLDSAAPPAAPGWMTFSLEARRENARARVRSWQRGHPGLLTMRIAVPAGPGGTLVWSAIARSLLSVGISPRRVPLSADADLRLIDQVAPYDSGRWFLVTACRFCSDDALAAIEAARDAPDLAQRAQAIATADALLTADGAYIPVAAPFRWSIVSGRLNGWQGNSRAWHPLNHLRNETE